MKSKWIWILVVTGIGLSLSLVAFWLMDNDQIIERPVSEENDFSWSKRLALVIGNSAYESGKLVNPLYDARDMAGALETLGFSVFLELNQDRRGMFHAIRKFGDQLGDDTVGLFYYAGHGIQVRNRNYLLPVDADIDHEDEVQSQAVEADLVLRKMREANNPLNLVILDACRNDPFENTWHRGINHRGLARMNAPSGTLIIYATRPGELAQDGEGRNSPFTRHLLANLKQPGLEVGRMIRRVAVELEEETKGRPSKTAFKASSAFGPQQSTYSVNPSLKPPTTGRLEEKMHRFRFRIRGHLAFPEYVIYTKCYAIFCTVFGPRN